MQHFFEVYKTLENKVTVVRSFGSADEARRLIARSIRAYDELFVQPSEPDPAEN